MVCSELPTPELHAVVACGSPGQTDIRKPECLRAMLSLHLFYPLPGRDMMPETNPSRVPSQSMFDTSTYKQRAA